MMPEPVATFRPHERVRAHADYQQIYAHGVKVHSGAFTLFRAPNGRPVGRLGIAATRKLGGAVVRNRAKRLVRETFRHNKLAPGYDIVVVPKRPLLDLSLADLALEFRHQLDRSTRRPR
jgi:ribonuclease P protein component